ncbi:MAG: AAA family ATPase [Planctomycetes bacterium]|nr:AAA family ATPase [Planctomycetota bacterium]
MKIRGWSIGGFGVFQDKRVDGVGDGFTVFLGPNEAGKSTLLAFLRGVFFGFPDGRSKEPRYRPLSGGRHGGCVFVENSSGEITIEREAARRRPARVVFPDGAEGSEEELNRLLGGADRQLFRSVFAFSLTELQTFASLNSDAVRDRIFSAGIAGAGRSAGAVQKRLDDELGRLLKGRGRGTVLMRLADALEANSKEIRKAQAVVDRYPELIDDENERCRHVEALETRSEDLHERQARYRNLIELWPIWCEMVEVREELEALAEIESESPAEFPEAGEVRLETVLERLKATESENETVRAELDADVVREGELQSLLDDAAHHASENISKLHSELAVHRERLRELGAEKGRRESIRKSCEELIEGLGPKWDEELVRGVDASIALREETRLWGEQLADAARQTELLEATKANEERELHRAEEYVERARGKLPKVEPRPEPVIESELDAVGRLRLKMTDRREAEGEVKRNAEAVRAFEQSLGDLVETDVWRPPRWLAGASIALASFSASLALWRWFYGKFWEGLLFGLVAVVCGVALAMGGGYLRRVKREAERENERRQRLETDLLAVRRSTEASTARSAALRSEMREDLALLKLDDESVFKSIELKDSDLRRQLKAAAEWARALGRVQEAEQRLDRARGEHDRVCSRLREARGEAGRVTSEWERWKEQRSIPDHLTPHGALDHLDAVQKTRERLETLGGVDERIAHLQGEISSWENRAEQVLQQVGRKLGRKTARHARRKSRQTVTIESENWIEALLELVRIQEEDRKVRVQLAELRSELERRRVRVEQSGRRLKRTQDDLAKLFADAGVEDEEKFRSRLQRHSRRVELDARLRECERRVTVMVGRGPDAESIRGELACGKVEHWKKELALIGTALQEAAAERDDAIRKHQDAKASRLGIEESIDLERLVTERSGLQREMSHHGNLWRVGAVAKALLNKTLQEFERHRQPLVLSQASNVLKTVTGGRYGGVRQSREEGEISVLHEDGTWRRSAELSRGTAEQLYLSLRLGLIAEYARRSVSLPLVMDDVLVNFDPGRQRGMVRALAEFAVEHQVLLFTCHPSTAELISEEVSGSRVREM